MDTDRPSSLPNTPENRGGQVPRKPCEEQTGGASTCRKRVIGAVDSARWRLRVIGAVVWQRWTSFIRYPANFASSLISPFVSLAVSMFMAKAFSSVPGAGAAASGSPGLPAAGSAMSAPAPLSGGSALASIGGANDFRSFLLVSTVLWTYIESQLYLGFGLQSEMRLGTLATVMQTPASRWSYLTGQAVYQFIRSTLNVLATVILAAACFGASDLLGADWPRTLAILGLDLLVVYGYGLVLAGLLMVFRSGFFSYLWDSLLPLLAGSTFSVTVLPPFLRRVGMAIPLTYGLDLLRWSVSGLPPILPPATEAWILGASAVILPLCGYGVFEVLERIARARGTLGQF